jgi:hypothetical protein
MFHFRNFTLICPRIKPGGEAAYADRIIELAGGLNTCIFVRSASEFAGRLV